MVSYEEYYALGEQIHESLIDIRGLESELIELNRMLENVRNKLDTVDLFQMPVRQ